MAKTFLRCDECSLLALSLTEVKVKEKFAGVIETTTMDICGSCLESASERSGSNKPLRGVVKK